MDMLRIGLLGVTLAAACVTDVRRHRIPNGLTFPVLLAGLILAEAQAGLHGVGIALAGIATASLTLLGYAARMLGAGDVKLFWAIGALMGPRFAGATMLWTALAGGLLGAAWVLARRGRRLPYAPAIAVGAATAWWLHHGQSGLS